MPCVIYRRDSTLLWAAVHAVTFSLIISYANMS